MHTEVKLNVFDLEKHTKLSACPFNAIHCTITNSIVHVSYIVHKTI